MRCHIKRHESSFPCITFHKCLIEDYHQKTFQSSFFKRLTSPDWRGGEDETPACRTQTCENKLGVTRSSSGDLLHASARCCSQHKTQAVLCCLFIAIWCEVMLARRGGGDEKQAKITSQKTLKPKALSSTPIFYAVEQSFPAGELITSLLAM